MMIFLYIMVGLLLGACLTIFAICEATKDVLRK